MSLDDEVPKIATSSDGSVQMVVMSPPADMVEKYHTLVADASHPPGYEEKLCSLGPFFEPAARRQIKQVARVTNMEASRLVREHHSQKRQQAKEVKTSANQFFFFV